MEARRHLQLFNFIVRDPLDTNALRLIDIDPLNKNWDKIGIGIGIGIGRVGNDNYNRHSTSRTSMEDTSTSSDSEDIT